MYAVKSVFQVSPTDRESFVAAMRQQQDYLEKQPGFHVRRTLRSRGYRDKYTTLTYWESAAAAEAVVFGTDYLEIARSTASVGAKRFGFVEAFDVMVDLGREAASGEVTEVVLAELAMAPAVREADFAKVREDLFRVLQAHEPALVRSRLLRFLGGGGRYIAVHAFTGQQRSVIELQELPEVAAFYRQYPNSTYLKSEPAAESFTPVPELATIRR